MLVENFTFSQALQSVRIAGLFLSTDYTDYTDFFLLPTDNTKSTDLICFIRFI